MLTTALQNDVYLASGSAHRELALEVAHHMGIDVQDDEIKTFPSGERYYRYGESIRGKHAVLIQSLSTTQSGSVNDVFVELLLMVDAARRSSAREITVVMPYMAYLRQDRKAKGREPISAAAIITTLKAAGAHRLVSIDMHSSQTQAVFNGPFDHLTAERELQTALLGKIGPQLSEYVVVSPDGGRAKTSESYADSLGVDVVYVPKKRDKSDSSVISRPASIDGVRDKRCILIDDLIDTAGTILSAAETLHNSGAGSVIIAATHGVFSGPALERLANPAISEVIVTDTIPQGRTEEALGDKLTIVKSAPIIASSLEAIVSGDSVLKIFDGKNYS